MEYVRERKREREREREREEWYVRYTGESEIGICNISIVANLYIVEKGKNEA